MGKSYDDITPELSHWIERQHMFFVATAPLARRWADQLLPERHGYVPHPGSARGRVSGPHRQRHRNGCPCPRERADCLHVLRLRRPAKDRPAPRNEPRCTVLGSPQYEFAQRAVSCLPRQSCDRPRAAHADQRFVRIRRATVPVMPAIEIRSSAGRNRKDQTSSRSTARPRTPEASMDCQASPPRRQDPLMPSESCPSNVSRRAGTAGVARGTPRLPDPIAREAPEAFRRRWPT